MTHVCVCVTNIITKSDSTLYRLILCTAQKELMPWLTHGKSIVTAKKVLLNTWKSEFASKMHGLLPVHNKY